MGVRMTRRAPDECLCQAGLGDERDDVCIRLALGYRHSVHMCLYEW
jgi:hypothetical protein